MHPSPAEILRGRGYQSQDVFLPEMSVLPEVVAISVIVNIGDRSFNLKETFDARHIDYSAEAAADVMEENINLLREKVSSEEEK